LATDKNTELVEIFDVGFNRKKRRIYFGTIKVEEDDDHGSVCWKSVEDAVKQLHTLVDDSAKKPIELHAYSWGGDAYAMMRMMDEIEACPCKVIFVGGGRVASAMTWIMAICDERTLHKNTTVMLHDGCDGIDGKHTDVQVDSRHGQELQSRLDRIFAQNSIMPKEFWEDILQRDVYLSPEECIYLGLADSVIQPKKRGNLRRSRIALMNQSREPKVLKRLVKSLYDRTNRKSHPRLEVVVPVEHFDPSIVVDDAADMEPLQKTDQIPEEDSQ